jgi:hypothetical protein
MSDPDANERVNDPIQADLETWVRHGHRAAGNRAAMALMVEWRPQVKRFLKDAASDRVDDALQGALGALCVFGSGGPPVPRAPSICGMIAILMR